MSILSFKTLNMPNSYCERIHEFQDFHIPLLWVICRPEGKLNHQNSYTARPRYLADLLALCTYSAVNLTVCTV